jgi:murein DD-endopeptidase MepM/ murein hydrolase activator NlpD
MNIRNALPILLMMTAGLAVILLSRLFHPIPQSPDIILPEPEPRMVYGLPADSFLLLTEVVGPGENLSAILSRHGLSMQEIDQLVRQTSQVFDVRQIRAGNICCLFYPDSNGRPAYFIYEKDRVNYIAYALGDSVYAWEGQKPVHRLMNRTEGVIENSLWMNMVNAGVNPNLALEMSEIYAWTIDFYAIQKGDAYKVMYEELWVDSVQIGIGQIPAAFFRHAGKEIYAFRFVQDSIPDYFDETGASLRRTFLKAPLRFSRISSHFSNSRLHPILRIRRPHHGVDYAAPSGTPVMTIGDGVVTKVGWSGGAGRMVKVKHNSMYTTAYLHLSKYGQGIREGVFVKQGQIIGYVGSSGLSTGPHLDFRFYKNGQAVDPLRVESPPAEPVDSIHLPRFHQYADSLRKRLDEVQP